MKACGGTCIWVNKCASKRGRFFTIDEVFSLLKSWHVSDTRARAEMSALSNIPIRARRAMLMGVTCSS